MITRLLQTIFTFFILLSSQITLAQVVVAGQTIGKSSWSDRAKLKLPNYKVEEAFSTPYENGPVLRVEGPLSGQIQGKAEFFYDKKRTLVAAKLFTRNPDALLKRVAKSSSARRNADGSFTLRDLRLRLESEDGLQLVQVSSPAFDADYTKSRSTASMPWKLNWLSYLAMGATSVLIWVFWRIRSKVWERRILIADYCAGLAAVSVVSYFVPAARLGMVNAWLALHLLGYGLILTWALRTVRLSGWLPKKPFVDLLWSFPAMPVLLLPVVVRNAVKSAHYAGLVLFFAQLFGLAYYYLRPDLMMSLKLLPYAGLLSAGVVRLYCVTFERFVKNDNKPVAAVIYTIITWPFFLVRETFVFALNVVQGFLTALLSLLIPIVVLIALGSIFEPISWLILVAFCLPFLAIIPAVVGTFAGSVVPTGYSSMEFGIDNFNPATGLPMMGSVDSAGNLYGTSFNSGFNINPANGQLMIGGFGGVDTFGNSYGSNMNDPW